MTEDSLLAGHRKSLCMCNTHSVACSTSWESWMHGAFRKWFDYPLSFTIAQQRTMPLLPEKKGRNTFLRIAGRTYLERLPLIMPLTLITLLFLFPFSSKLPELKSKFSLSRQTPSRVPAKNNFISAFVSELRQYLLLLPRLSTWRRFLISKQNRAVKDESKAIQLLQNPFAS